MQVTSGGGNAYIVFFKDGEHEYSFRADLRSVKGTAFLLITLRYVGTNNETAYTEEFKPFRVPKGSPENGFCSRRARFGIFTDIRWSSLPLASERAKFRDALKRVLRNATGLSDFHEELDDHIEEWAVQTIGHSQAHILTPTYTPITPAMFEAGVEAAVPMPTDYISVVPPDPEVGKVVPFGAPTKGVDVDPEEAPT